MTLEALKPLFMTTREVAEALRTSRNGLFDLLRHRNHAAVMKLLRAKAKRNHWRTTLVAEAADLLATHGWPS